MAFLPGKMTFVVLALIALSLTAARARADFQMPGQAEGILNELESSSSSALIFGSGINTSFGIGAGYSRTFLDMIQGTLVSNFNVTSYPVGGITSFTVKVGPTYNYSLDTTGLHNAFYIRALVGFALTGNSTTGTSQGSTNFAYTGEIGKRFEIFTSNVCWKPAFNISGITTTNSNPVFSIIPAQFSFLF